ncbi:ArsR/SmtB family transcription factor [Gordonia neofelifaecis]|uniref:Transcriptional regulator, ArsR family protein n=1 Tax=Gordonia neofelifaecis NRRL B-59395 TaxID=644548 RepID=F1YE23_9ACTN|nr:metalloregulator ArsR/SmtB family transcription factor [Gordonia neofelifaecis]EGD57113.1 transcriptional regulator, ArsR family protein [Gordonia neofelifaecis NRRL B-59395]
MLAGVTTTDDVFLALANPVRRRLLEILAEGPLSAGELSDRFTLSRPAVAEHLKLLRDVGLVADDPQGRRRIYRLTAAPLAELDDWLHPFERFWRGRLSALATLAEDIHRGDES